MEEIRNRAQIPDKYKWDMTALYETNEAWEAECKAVNAELQDFAALAGTLGDEAALLNALRRMFDLSRRMERLFTYASCRRDEDTANPTYPRLSDMAMHTYQELMQAAAFVEPELLSLDESYIKAVMDKPAFKDYRVYLKGVMHMRPHTLSRELETLIASTSEMKGAPTLSIP